MTPDAFDKPAAASRNAFGASEPSLGHFTRMMLLFFLLPVCFLVAASVAYYWQLKTLTFQIITDNCGIVERISQEQVDNTVKDSIKKDFGLLQQTMVQMTRKTELTLLIVFGLTVWLMGGIVLSCTRRLKTNLSDLAKAAERIRAIEHNTRIQVGANNEIRDLAESISRIQERLRLSIERLRRRP